MLWCKPGATTIFADFSFLSTVLGWPLLIVSCPDSLTCFCFIWRWVCRRQFDRSWQIFDKVSSISQSRELGACGGRFLQPTTLICSFHKCNLGFKPSYVSNGESHFFQPGLSLNQHKWYVWWKYTYLGFWKWQLNGVHFKIDFVNIWPNLGRNPAETFQEDDYHIFGLAVLDDHEWMVLRRIGNESGTELGWGLAGK